MCFDVFQTGIICWISSLAKTRIVRIPYTFGKRASDTIPSGPRFVTPQKLIRWKPRMPQRHQNLVGHSGGLQALGQFLSEEIFVACSIFCKQHMIKYVIEAGKKISDITRSYRFFLVDSHGFPWPPGPSSLWRSFICSLHRRQFYSGFHRGRSPMTGTDNGQWFRWVKTSSCQERGERNKEVEVRASDILDTYDSSEERFLDDNSWELSLLGSWKRTLWAILLSLIEIIVSYNPYETLFANDYNRWHTGLFRC